MDPEIYEAALLIPKSARGIKASVQIYSTMHRAYGLMNGEYERARRYWGAHIECALNCWRPR